MTELPPTRDIWSRACTKKGFRAGAHGSHNAQAAHGHPLRDTTFRTAPPRGGPADREPDGLVENGRCGWEVDSACTPGSEDTGGSPTRVPAAGRARPILAPGFGPHDAGRSASATDPPA